MPLTGFQAELGRLLAANRSEDSYLAGGAAILAEPHSRRYSRDLDYFHDSAERVATAYAGLDLAVHAGHAQRDLRLPAASGGPGHQQGAGPGRP
ncbi:MAG: hypothetical protein IH621_12570 [Krumholzibacteria bacterium]|nr:hypothetical protein [Candidatus Krumholzibacteria bacterium]